LLRKAILEEAPQFGNVRRQLNRERYKVGNQAALTEIFPPRNHDRLLHTGVLAEGCCNLPRLHPKTADLDLIIGPAEEVESTIGAISHSISGPVEAATRNIAEGVRHEALRGEPWTPEIATSQACSPDVQLAGNAYRQGPEMPVQNVD
jgi:hypothetical protein